jgi:hypothetical protein
LEVRVHRSISSWLVAAGLLAAAGCNGTINTSTDGTGGTAGPTGPSGTGGSQVGTGSGAGGSSVTAGTGGTTGTGGTAGPTGAGGAGVGGRGAGGSTTTPGTGGAGGASTGLQPFKGVANSACNDLATLKTSWWYNWTTGPSGCAAAGFVPMIAGKSEKTAAAVTSALGRIATAGYTTVLGFNEPNKTDQANLTVAQVVALWPQITANPAVRVGSPSTSADAPGQAWFTDFMTQAAAQSFRIDFITLHWYGWNAGSCDAKAAQLESYIKWAEAIPGNKPIWLTEWGCLNLSNPDIATVQAFYTAALAVFAKHPRIERYAWYPWTTNNNLVDAADALTSLGTAFANAPSTH